MKKLMYSSDEYVRNPINCKHDFFNCDSSSFKRMLLRGDKKEDAEKRIAHDRIAFKEENIAKVDFHINNQDVDIEKVTDDVYQKYLETLKQRKK